MHGNVIRNILAVPEFDDRSKGALLE